MSLRGDMLNQVTPEEMAAAASIAATIVYQACAMEDAPADTSRRGDRSVVVRQMVFRVDSGHDCQSYERKTLAYVGWKNLEGKAADESPIQ